jgi:hypothetical protein
MSIRKKLEQSLKDVQALSGEYPTNNEKIEAELTKARKALGEALRLLVEDEKHKSSLSRPEP